ncbi:MAG: ornithine cyclodeaminase family protein [Clostridiaceae bacterium]|nr:ornithine cyclodeaminase family protein [Clostridiaceae bacterium]
MEITVLSQAELKQVLELDRVIASVESVYKQKAGGRTAVWPSVEYHFEEEQAVMDIRSGYLAGDKLHGAKMLNNFPLNAQAGLPAFTGMLLIFDSTSGMPLALMDASYITSMRTGAAAALGVRTLARKNSKNLLLVGAGRQAFFMVAATLLAMPQLENVRVHDPLDSANAEKFVSQIERRLKAELNLNLSGKVNFTARNDLQAVLQDSDAVITVTRATSPIIKQEWVQSGTHFSCIGADMLGKEELDPELFRTARAFADDKKQCLAFGEMEIPYKAGIISEQSIQAELGEVLAGTAAGRISEADITIFDATGLALLDLATGKLALDLARRKGLGQKASI